MKQISHYSNEMVVEEDINLDWNNNKPVVNSAAMSTVGKKTGSKDKNSSMKSVN
jgi:hypothetical protein